MVGRTFGRFMKYRRLARDYETEEMSETMIRTAMIDRMHRKLCRPELRKQALTRVSSYL